MSTNDLVAYKGTTILQERVVYQSRVGSLIYPTSISRPDIVFASSRLARFMYNPGEIHLMAADRVIRYLDGTRTYALEFGGLCEVTINIFEGSSDILFANLLNIRSTQG
jgi:hypothetical protein